MPNHTTLQGRRFPDGQPITVRIIDGRITDVASSEAADHALKNGADTSQRWLLPGFCDLQVNGFAGRSFISSAVTVDDVDHIARAVLATGTTRFLPTVITADLDIMCHQLSVIAETLRTNPLVAAMCPGVHVEGPFIRPEDGPRGADPREHVRIPSREDYDRLNVSANGRIAVLTLAPEVPGALDLIRYVSQSGVVVALGHHRADGAAIDSAIAAGATLCTHLGNGCDSEIPRHDNLVWRQLGDDRLSASFIADGHHLPAHMLRCMLRAKTVARSVLVTDAIAAAGMPAGRYPLGDIEVERTAEGRVCLPGTPFLAGSAAEMPTVVGRAVIDGDVSFVDAVRMASVQPASLLGHRINDWSCEPDAWANLIEADWQPASGQVIVRRVVFGPWTIQPSPPLQP